MKPNQSNNNLIPLATIVLALFLCLLHNNNNNNNNIQNNIFVSAQATTGFQQISFFGRTFVLDDFVTYQPASCTIPNSTALPFSSSSNDDEDIHPFNTRKIRDLQLCTSMTTFFSDNVLVTAPVRRDSAWDAVAPKGSCFQTLEERLYESGTNFALFPNGTIDFLSSPSFSCQTFSEQLIRGYWCAIGANNITGYRQQLTDAGFFSTLEQDRNGGDFFNCNANTGSVADTIQLAANVILADPFDVQVRTICNKKSDGFPKLEFCNSSYANLSSALYRAQATFTTGSQFTCPDGIEIVCDVCFPYVSPDLVSQPYFLFVFPALKFVVVKFIQLFLIARLAVYFRKKIENRLNDTVMTLGSTSAFKDRIEFVDYLIQTVLGGGKYRIRSRVSLIAPESREAVQKLYRWYKDDEKQDLLQSDANEIMNEKAIQVQGCMMTKYEVMKICYDITSQLKTAKQVDDDGILSDIEEWFFSTVCMGGQRMVPDTQENRSLLRRCISDQLDVRARRQVKFFLPEMDYVYENNTSIAGSEETGGTPRRGMDRSPTANSFAADLDVSNVEELDLNIGTTIFVNKWAKRARAKTMVRQERDRKEKEMREQEEADIKQQIKDSNSRKQKEQQLSQEEKQKKSQQQQRQQQDQEEEQNKNKKRLNVRTVVAPEDDEEYEEYEEYEEEVEEEGEDDENSSTAQQPQKRESDDDGFDLLDGEDDIVDAHNIEALKVNRVPVSRSRKFFKKLGRAVEGAATTLRDAADDIADDTVQVVKEGRKIAKATAETFQTTAKNVGQRAVEGVKKFVDVADMLADQVKEELFSEEAAKQYRDPEDVEPWSAVDAMCAPRQVKMPAISTHLGSAISCSAKLNTNRTIEQAKQNRNNSSSSTPATKATPNSPASVFSAEDAASETASFPGSDVDDEYDHLDNGRSLEEVEDTPYNPEKDNGDAATSDDDENDETATQASENASGADNARVLKKRNDQYIYKPPKLRSDKVTLMFRSALVSDSLQLGNDDEEEEMFLSHQNGEYDSDSSSLFRKNDNNEEDDDDDALRNSDRSTFMTTSAAKNDDLRVRTRTMKVKKDDKDLSISMEYVLECTESTSIQRVMAALWQAYMAYKSEREKELAKKGVTTASAVVAPPSHTVILENLAKVDIAKSNLVVLFDYSGTRFQIDSKDTIKDLFKHTNHHSLETKTSAKFKCNITGREATDSQKKLGKSFMRLVQMRFLAVDQQSQLHQIEALGPLVLKPFVSSEFTVNHLRNRFVEEAVVEDAKYPVASLRLDTVEFVSRLLDTTLASRLLEATLWAIGEETFFESDLTTKQRYKDRNYIIQKMRKEAEGFDSAANFMALRSEATFANSSEGTNVFDGSDSDPSSKNFHHRKKKKGALESRYQRAYRVFCHRTWAVESFKKLLKAVFDEEQESELQREEDEYAEEEILSQRRQNQMSPSSPHGNIDPAPSFCALFEALSVYEENGKSRVGVLVTTEKDRAAYHFILEQMYDEVHQTLIREGSSQLTLSALQALVAQHRQSIEQVTTLVKVVKLEEQVRETVFSLNMYVVAMSVAYGAVFLILCSEEAAATGEGYFDLSGPSRWLRYEHIYSRFLNSGTPASLIAASVVNLIANKKAREESKWFRIVDYSILTASFLLVAPATLTHLIPAGLAYIWIVLLVIICFAVPTYLIVWLWNYLVDKAHEMIVKNATKGKDNLAIPPKDENPEDLIAREQEEQDRLTRLGHLKAVMTFICVWGYLVFLILLTAATQTLFNWGFLMFHMKDFDLNYKTIPEFEFETRRTQCYAVGVFASAANIMQFVSTFAG